MEGPLAQRTGLATEHAMIADIAMYGYIRVVDEGGLDLTCHPAIVYWLANVEQTGGIRTDAAITVGWF